MLFVFYSLSYSGRISVMWAERRIAQLQRVSLISLKFSIFSYISASQSMLCPWSIDSSTIASFYNFVHFSLYLFLSSLLLSSPLLSPPFLYFSFLFGSIEDTILGFLHVMQMLYHWAAFPTFCLVLPLLLGREFTEPLTVSLSDSSNSPFIPFLLWQLKH